MENKLHKRAIFDKTAASEIPSRLNRTRNVWCSEAVIYLVNGKKKSKKLPAKPCIIWLLREWINFK